MEVISLSHPAEVNNKRKEVLTIGFFDGVHLGHRELLCTAKTIAKDTEAFFQ